jgi:succinate-acetate transporter protein
MSTEINWFSISWILFTLPIWICTVVLTHNSGFNKIPTDTLVLSIVLAAGAIVHFVAYMIKPTSLYLKPKNADLSTLLEDGF